MKFSDFSTAVQSRFAELAKSDKLFVVDADRDEIWKRYLAAFPPGTDPLLRKKTEHDCSCCRHFIRAAGNVVSLKDGVMGTVWDVTGLPPAYQTVADAMAAYIRSCKVADILLTKFPNAGQPFSTVQLENGTIVKWDHFAVTIPSRFIHKEPDTKKGEARTTRDVLARGIKELDPGAVATVLDLIDQNAIYRGAEHRNALAAFQTLQTRARAGNELLIWELHDAPAARLRNTAIGTLIQDLSEGMELENAVKSFEAKVAPQNYKRPTALITKGMVEAAMKTITELDLEPALERRHAKLSDVSVNSVLWVDGTVQGKMKGGLAGKLMEEVKPAEFDPKKAKPISIAEFLALPHKNGIKLYLDNGMLPHFVSLTAPVHPGSKSLFKWDNDFAWSYEGNIADSLRDKVAALGGRVDGAFRFSHTWNYDRDRPNKSLMDLHVFMPGSSEHKPKFGEHYPSGRRVGWNQRNDFASGGVQDVDYVLPPADDFVPVENISFPDIRRMPEGTYVMKIHNWSRRTPTRSGFKAEIEFAGQIFHYEHREPLAQKEWVTVAEVTLHKGEFSIRHVMTSSASSQDVWGLKTLDQVKVNAIVLSPNYWGDNAVGNKHTIFLLDGCLNPNPCRGIYNEFLHQRLEPHRKVFEVLADKTKVPPVAEQLSGVGFSSTRKDRVVAVSGGAAYAIQF